MKDVKRNNNKNFKGKIPSWYQNNNNKNFKGIIPSWYQNLCDNYVLSNNLRLIHPLNDVITDINRTHASPSITPAISTPKSQWTIHWNNSQKHVILVRLYPKNLIDQLLLLTFNITWQVNPTMITQKLLIFNIFKKSSSEHKSLLPFYNNQPFFVATKPFHTFRHIVDNSPLKIITPNIVNPSFVSTNITFSKHVFNHIDNALICHPTIKLELKSCAKILANESLLTFYTDGSVQHIGSTHSLSGYGWTQFQPSTPKITFKGSTVFFPSSTKSETMGILTAIIVSPYNCNLNDYTNSASCIQLFNTRLHSPVISPRQKLKQTNFLLWDLIFFLIHEKNLLVSMHKVAGHSDNIHNNEADTLAKAGAHIKEPITNFFLNKPWASSRGIIPT
ncbi:hypothetical protein RhiirA1_461073 [Rhizophagus irregularis]|uniref:RNase H type-1 domain-containing protein n=1 Tax=Rhizophagus irregularis TaxID=588596 RepID=A0A2N0RQ37_9GLOM|nr:hypothetical protein RhiirA1_461073 [Rhizophagus irregularis]